MSSSFLILGDGHEKNSNYGVNNQVELQQSKLWPNSEFNKKQCMYYFSACKPTSDKTCSHSVSNMDAAATDCKKKKDGSHTRVHPGNTEYLYNHQSFNLL